jgi:hypothetical protein
MRDCLACWCEPCVCDADELSHRDVACAALARAQQARRDALPALPPHPVILPPEVAGKLLRACQRAHRSVCATMNPNCDLARELREAIHAALGVRP